MSASKRYKVSELMKKVPNKFVLSLATAKRARQIKEGSKPMVELSEQAPVPIVLALEEIQNDKINVNLVKKIAEKDQILDEISDYLDAESEEIVDDEPEDQDNQKKKKKESKSKKKSKSLAA